MKYRIKNGVRDWELRNSHKRIWKYQIVVSISSSADEPQIFARGLFKGPVQIWVLTDDLWGGAARLGNPDALSYPESHRYFWGQNLSRWYLKVFLALRIIIAIFFCYRCRFLNVSAYSALEFYFPSIFYHLNPVLFKILSELEVVFPFFCPPEFSIIAFFPSTFSFRSIGVARCVVVPAILDFVLDYSKYFEIYPTFL